MVKSKEKSLYEVLGVEKESSQAEIKKAYLKLALKLHPDKNPGDQEANDKFQALQRIYAVLGDPEKRKVYDQTGSIEDSEELAGDQFESLYKFYRTIYKQISEEDIMRVEAAYRGSAEEKEDVVTYYEKLRGEMNALFSYVIGSDPAQDSHRFMDIIEEAIRDGKVKLFRGFAQWAKATVSKPRPVDPLKPRPKTQKDKQDESALVTAIQARGKSRLDNLAASLEAKYAKPASKRRPSAEEPSEEEFAAAAARVQKRKSEKGTFKSKQKGSGEMKAGAANGGSKAPSKKRKT